MGVAIFIIALGGVVYLMRHHPDWGAVFPAMVAWIQARGAEAVLWLLILQALQVLLAIPGPFFTMVAGFLYGTTMGTGVAVVGTTAGSVVAYGLARLARASRSPRELAAPPCEPSGRFATFRRVVMGGGWKVVLSSRLIPFFPFKLSNYFFGWVRFPFGAFFWGTFLGIIPVTLISVSAGALASDLASLAHPDFSAKGRWGGALAGLAVAAVMLVWAGWKARAELRRASRIEAIREEAKEAALDEMSDGAGDPG
ncbi:MAG TPA: VTT domain-containing protein [Fibrobacteria bacterium]|nr:VTT domain-containing protein [Fibrobacteria bacterium]